MRTYSPPCIIPVVIVGLRLGFFIMMFLGSPVAISHGQVNSSITPDGTLGTSVTQNGTVHDINGGRIRGTNQFHSFGKFSVGTGDVASFNGPSSIANILSRVTGGQQSQIDGTLRSTIPGANLYLMNPAGVLFGPNASLDLSGSLHVTTADYLRLGDNVQFSGKPDLAKDGLLTTAPVAAFGFLSTTPAPITIQHSALAVSEGQTLSIIGGDVAFVGDPVTGYLVAPGGVVNIAGVASPGEVVLVASEQPTLNVGSFARLGTIALSQLATIDSSSLNGSGTVVIRGGRLTMDNSVVSSLTLDLDGRTRGIDIQLAGSFILTNGASVGTASLGEGRSGDLTIAANKILLQSGGSIDSGTFGSGQAGSVTVTVADILAIEGTATPGVLTGITSQARPGSSGDAGTVTVSAHTLTLLGNGGISGITFGSGRAGSVLVTVADALLIDGTATPSAFAGIASDAAPGSSGDAGQVTVSARTLTLLGHGSIDSVTFGSGRAGAVLVTVTDALLIDGTTTPNSVTGISSDAARGSGGDAGQVTVSARTLTLQGGGAISSATFGSGRAGAVLVTVADALLIDGAATPTLFTGISSEAEPDSSGDAGTVTVSARALTLEGGGEISSATFGAGRAGSVLVTVADALLIDGTATPTLFTGITSEATPGSIGDAGAVMVSARMLILQGGGEIGSGTFGSGRGGTVNVTASDSLLITGTLSGLFSNSIGDFSGHGGDIQVRAGTVTLADSATISASSTGTGNAGNIFIHTDDFDSRNSFLTTQALQSDGGNIELQVGHQIHLTHSDITTSVGTGAGNGGNISIDPQFFIVDHSRIVANAAGGKGGNITMTAGVFLASPDSVIDASSALGINGVVAIQSPVQNLSGSLSPLPSNLLTIAPLTSQCAARAQGGSFSSFTVAGRDGVPAEPGGLLPSPLQAARFLTDAEKHATASWEPNSPSPLLLTMSWKPCR